MVLFIDDVRVMAVENNGGTFHKVQPGNGTVAWEEDKFRDDGYWVSVGRGIENLPKLRLQTMFDFIDSRPKIMTGETFLGLWNEEFKSSDTENWSIDESVWVKNRDEAIELGIKNNQKAIFDVYNNLVITL